MKLEIPAQLDETKVFPFLQKMWDALTIPQLTLDYSDVKYAYPFGSLILAEEVKSFLKKRDALNLKTTYTGYNQELAAHSYLAHIGFFKHQRIPEGKLPGQAWGSNTYMPFKTLTYEFLNQRMQQLNIPLGEAVEHESDELTKIVLQTSSQPRHGHPVTYCFREVIRNVFEHGQIDQCHLCAQRWHDGFLEIAVIDRGQGIKESLSEQYTFANNFDALNAAIQPAISRIAFTEKDDNVWQNSGYGLYVLSSLASKTGEFLLCSGDAALYLQGDIIAKREYQFEGTAVKLRMKKPKGENVNEMIRRIVKEGEESQPRGTLRRASKSTRLI